MPERKWFMGVAEHAGYLILRLRYYPAWSVNVNGIPVKAIADRERGLIAVPVPQGRVQVAANWTTSSDVMAGRWVSGVALLLLIGLHLFERKRLWAPSNPDGASSPVSTEKRKLPKDELKHPVRSVQRERKIHRPASRPKKPGEK